MVSQSELFIKSIDVATLRHSKAIEAKPIDDASHHHSELLHTAWAGSLVVICKDQRSLRYWLQNANHI